MVTGSRRIEFWPDYGGALLHEGGEQVPLAGLPIGTDLTDRATAWVAGYDDTKLDGAQPDDAWLAEGRALFTQLREALAQHDIDLFDWEGYWSAGVEPR